MWDKTDYSFGNVKKGEKYFVTFKYLGSSKIKSVKAGCSCSNTKHTHNTVTVQYTAPEFPQHLKVMGVVTSIDTKSIAVETEDNRQYLLTIKGVLQA